MALEVPILIKGGTEAEREAATLSSREPNFTSDGKRMYVGAQIVGWPIEETAVALSAAGDTTLSLTAGYPLHLWAISAAAGAGAYTAKLILPETEAGGAQVRNGTLCDLQIVFAASTNPTVQVRNETSGGTTLWTFTPPEASARTFVCRFARISGNWVLWTTNEPLIS